MSYRYYAFEFRSTVMLKRFMAELEGAKERGAKMVETVTDDTLLVLQVSTGFSTPDRDTTIRVSKLFRKAFPMSFPCDPDDVNPKGELRDMNRPVGMVTDAGATVKHDLASVTKIKMDSPVRAITIHEAS